MIAACVLLPCAIELVSTRRLLASIRRLPHRTSSVDPTTLAHAVDRFTSGLPWIWRRTCLRRAIVLAALLERAGTRVDVVYGVRADAGTLAAHAWLTKDGSEPYLENPTTAATFTQLKTGFRVAP